MHISHRRGNQNSDKKEKTVASITNHWIKSNDCQTTIANVESTTTTTKSATTANHELDFGLIAPSRGQI